IHGTKVTVIGLDKDSTQGDKTSLNILEAMGCTVEWNGNAVTVTGPETLKGGEFDLNPIPDTLPILAVTASYAHGDVHLTNVPQARIKETDRIDVMTKNLRKMGVEVEEEPDGMLIHGKGTMKGTQVMGYGDHRVIMAMATAASKAEGETEIDDISAVSVTFPTFFELYETLKD
ncbi:MAG: 3-phosphoshikimate 1-carboxyvinyltransferase, partial [Spirochaetales bacterium]|nr:3-phosphoshikimate 1-carboxyvinyltransferase [Candidatus Physcosoma equi]